MPPTDCLRLLNMVDDQFTAKAFDLSNFENDAAQRVTMTFVWDARTAARRTSHRPPGCQLKPVSVAPVAIGLGTAHTVTA